ALPLPRASLVAAADFPGLLTQPTSTASSTINVNAASIVTKEAFGTFVAS
ncbi:unnamed protein product, partial [Rhizoctonia solani]